MTPITLVGNATGDAELKFSQAGKPWATVSVAVTPREKQPDGSYADGEAAFYRVACFGSLAENVAESVTRGTRVLVVGTLKPRTYEHQGEKRMSLDVVAEHVGVELRFATATTNRAQRGAQAPASQPNSAWGSPSTTPAPNGPQNAVQDPWNQDTGAGGWGQQPTITDEPPF